MKDFNLNKFILTLLKTIGVLVCSLVFVATLHPAVRAQIRSLVNHDYREVLSTASADFLGDGTQFKVVKVKTNKSLYLEFYKIAKDGSSQLFQKINMEDKRDGYFNYKGRATNLVISEIGPNRKLEILAPSFDKDLIAHLNVFAYDPATQRFVRDNSN